jgi:adenylate kinase
MWFGSGQHIYNTPFFFICQVARSPKIGYNTPMANPHTTNDLHSQRSNFLAHTKNPSSSHLRTRHSGVGAKKPVIFFLSKSGGGKDTQADILIEEKGFDHINSGDLLRSFTSDSNTSTLSKDSVDYYEAAQIRSILNQGRFVPTLNIVCQWRATLIALVRKKSSSKGIVFVGSPRKLAEAMLLHEFFINWPDAAKYFQIIPILIDVSDKEARRRLSLRRQCKKCRKVVSGEDAHVSVCPRCGGALIRRADDTPQGITSRLKEYKEHVAPVAEYFKKQKLLKIVHGEGSILQIHKEIHKIL